MLFKETQLAGAYVIELEPRHDERGFFARSFCAKEFGERGLPTRFPQSNLSRNTQRGTLRGMHFEALPSSESKLVRCVAGAIYDVILDMRRGSPTRWQWIGVELNAENARGLFVPAGFAHGFLTLADATDVTYEMGDMYRPGAARGLRWNDPTFDIRWPEAPRVISERDAGYPDFNPATFDD